MKEENIEKDNLYSSLSDIPKDEIYKKAFSFHSQGDFENAFRY